jgi:hypothetical protein
MQHEIQRRIGQLIALHGPFYRSKSAAPLRGHFANEWDSAQDAKR